MMCSNRWAKPLRPWRSSFEPTWYQTWTFATGTEWSSWRITLSPLASWCSRTLISGGVTLRVTAESAWAVRTIPRVIPRMRAGGSLRLNIRFLPCER
jgi:hypothetical protein